MARSSGVPEGKLHIGTVVKPHGIRGEVVVEPVTNRPERFAVGAVHERSGDATGSGGTLLVAGARRHQGRWIVAYEGVADRNAADDMRGTMLFGDPIDVLDEGEQWVHELIGRDVVDHGGAPRGRIVAVEVNPAHDILVLDTGALVPVVFVTDAGSDPVEVDVPAGLFDEELIAANRAGSGRRRRGRKAEKNEKGQRPLGGA